MLNAQKYIEIVKSRGQRKLPLERVYRLIRHRDLFLAAYGKLYANKGATTPGVNPEDTVDGMSLKRIEQIINQLEAGTYRWTPVQRTYIEKKSGGKRALGLPAWSDKLLQEVIRMILEAYYEPQFADSSHGFRPGRGCHTALQTIRNQWRGTVWFIEGDIEKCFDNLDHDLIVSLIERNIHDQRFSKLLKEMLRAGYMEDWRHHRTHSGTVQGGVISPLLTNIVLNELDQFVTNELVPQYTRGTKRQDNPEYRRLSNDMKKARRCHNLTNYRQLVAQRRLLPASDPDDPGFRRLRYCRYADDFVLGFIGPKQEAVEIKAKIEVFLQTLHLTLSPQKTLITHAVTEKARFLGYELNVVRNNHYLTHHQLPSNCHKASRARNGEVVLSVPGDVVTKWQRKYQRYGKPVHHAYLRHSSDYEIVNAYDIEMRGLINYYSLAHNIAKRLSRVYYVSRQSLVKTIAAKHKKRSSWVYRRYTSRLEDGRKVIQVTIPRDPPKRPLVATFGAKRLRCLKTTMSNDVIPRVYPGRTELVQRLLANECELCGATQDIEVHHIRKLADVSKQYQGRKEPPQWVVFMLGRRRKTIVVCHRCHRQIHEGRYNGPKLA